MRLHQYLVGWLAAPMFLSASVLWSPLAALAQVEAHAPTPLLQTEGALTSDSPILSGDGTPYAEHTFEGQAGQTVTVVMESLVLDAYLFLYSPDGQKLGENDDFDAVNYNAVITLTLPVDGTYRIMANAYESAGAYTLTVVNGEVPVFSEVAQRQVEARRLNRRAMAQSDVGEYEAALELLNQAILVWREVGDRKGEAISLNNLGFVFDSLSDYPQALDYYQQALAIHLDIGDRRNEATALNNIGGIYSNLSDYPQALTFYRQSLAIRQDIGDRSGEIYSLNNIGRVTHILGDSSTALDHYQQALAIQEELKDLKLEALLLNNVAGVYDSRGDYPQALDYYQRALAIHQESGDRASEAIVLNNIAGIQSSLSDYHQALNYYQKALEIQQAIGDRNNEATSLDNIGGVHSSLGSYSLALDYHRQALTIRQAIGDRNGEAISLSNIGYVYYHLSDYSQASDYYQQSLAVHQANGNLSEEASTLGNIGSVYSTLGDYALSIDFHQQALEIRRTIGDREGEAISFNNLGVVHDSKGDYASAIDSYQQALAILQSLRNREGEATVINNIGSVYENQSDYFRALNYYQQALDIRQAIGNRQGEASSLSFMGGVHDSLGNYLESLNYYQQALAIRQDIGDRQGAGATLNGIAKTYFELENYSLSLDYAQQALGIFEAIGDRPSAGGAWANIGSIHRELGVYDQALDAYQQALAIAENVGHRYTVGMALSALGETYRQLNDYPQSLDYHQQALAVLESLGARDRTSAALRNLGRTLADQGQPELAIVFYKQSINLTEVIRGEIQGLEQGLQQSYADSIAEGYRELADLLLQQDRVLEAQRVLDLLKVQELDDYLHNVRGTEQTATGLDMWQPEQRILALYDQTIQEGGELAALEAKPSLTAAETQRRDELLARQDELRGAFRQFRERQDVREAIAQLRTSTDGQNIELSHFNQLQNSLADLDTNAVLLYPLILDNRLELVLITPTGAPIRRPVPVNAVDLNRAIVELGQALKNPQLDAQAPAQRLYKWLIAPLANDLAAANAETIIYAPDGALRYIPLGALHDGEQWLAERFAVSHITAASLIDFTARPSYRPDNLELLAAACVQCSFENINGYRFADLPHAGVEVETLAAQIPNTELRLNEAFNADELRTLMRRFPVVHLATHAKFLQGQGGESFIVTGDGNSVSLRDMQSWNLDADLVVLSACETAVGEAQLGSGVEILGFGYQMQGAGAKAAIASLWQVSDGGTQVLMNSFYAALQAGHSKAKALQLAQQALISGEFEMEGQGDRADANLITARTGLPAAVSDNLDHPYYWAPFILIGNGL